MHKSKWQDPRATYDSYKYWSMLRALKIHLPFWQGEPERTQQAKEIL